MAEPLPYPEEAPSPEEEIAALEQALDAIGTEAGSVTVADEPPPIGRSWAWDDSKPGFVVAPGGRGPAETFGDQTLTTWCIKALQTAQGAHPIYPSDYGLADANRWVGKRLTTADHARLEAAIHDALTFHPRIIDVIDFDAYQDPDQEVLEVSFTVVRDDGETTDVETVLFGD